MRADMRMRADLARNDDLAGGIDAARRCAVPAPADMDDVVALDGDDAVLEAAMRGAVEGDDGAAGDENVGVAGVRCHGVWSWLRKRSLRRRSSSIAAISTTETTSSTTAAAVMVGLMFSLTPLKIWRGSVRCCGLARNSATTISSNEVTKANSAPDTTPGAMIGSVTVRNAWAGVAPRLAAARVRLGSKPCRVADTVMTTNGSASTVCAMIRPM